MSTCNVSSGDPSLISVRGLRYLSTADVVVYDRLVHGRLLRSVRPDAEQNAIDYANLVYSKNYFDMAVQEYENYLAKFLT